ncbi:MAG: sporulation integral membrane protein YtvI [Oscillospiraceae bacterium]|nr:sporulation integral membrane protein YtvI [Oscillospiraceae bacterium]
MKKPWKLLLYILGGIAGIWLTAKFIFPIGLPFLFGLGLARLGERPIVWLGKQGKFPRWLSSFVVISLLSVAVGGLIWLLGRWLFSELESLAQRLPQILPNLTSTLTELHSRLLLLANKLPETLSAAVIQWLEQLFAGSSVVMDTASGWLIGLVGNVLGWVPDLFLFLLTMLLSSYLFASQQPQLQQKVRKVVPESWRKRLSAMKNRLKTALGGYCKAQLYLIGLNFLLLVAGLFLLGRNKVLLAALLIALLDALPVFGAGAVLIPWSVFSFLQGNTSLALGLLLLYAVCALARSFLEPKLLGKQIGLSPLLTLLSLYAGFRLFGVLGMLLVPVGVILVKQLYDLVEATEK